MGLLIRQRKQLKQKKKIGADAVKIQSYTPDTMTLNCTKSDFLINEGLWKGNSLYELYIVKRIHPLNGIKNYLSMQTKKISLYFLLL